MKKILSVILAALMLTSVLAIGAFAAGEEFLSPSNPDFYNVTVSVKDNKGGTVNADKTKVPAGETATIVAKPDENNTFNGWTFTGAFEWVRGDANSTEIEIRPLEDVAFVADFGDGVSKDPGAISPVTGYNTTALFAVIALAVVLSAGAVVYTGRKYAKVK